jgi:hypothetical protein
VPLETASYLSDLEPSYPISTDLVRQADDHIRLLKNTLQNTFPNLDGPVTATPEQLNNAAPVGLIALWYGSSASCPDGWAVCDGSSVAKSDGSGNITTPNLVDRFVVGAGGTLADQGETGGAATYAVTTASGGAHSHATSGGAHTHTGTVGGTALTTAQLPAHAHNLKTGSITVDAGGSATFTGISSTGTGSSSYIENTGSAATHNHTVTIDSATPAAGTTDTAAAHTHTLTVPSIPPSIGLHYIMKV